MTPTLLREWTSDSVWFPALQCALIAFVLFAVFRNWFLGQKAGRGGATLSVTRGDISMGRFYGTYAAISGLLVAVCLTVDINKDHRVFWTIVDTVLVAYVCIFNPWFRNLLLGWSEKLKRVEKR